MTGVRIDALDGELLRLLNERARIALKVGESKKEAGASLCDHTREREVIERMTRAGGEGFDADARVCRSFTRNWIAARRAGRHP
ncbi:MAG TPA: chorismate mutase [Blastocatellia bacterium]|nr:chorismate mutase [Blastocatellia bacterium]